MISSSTLPKKHPKEMVLLAIVEMCQRFAFWGIADLLALYLVQYHSMSESKADQIFGIFTGVAFLLPLFGGYIADRWNYKEPIVLGSIFTAIGCFLVAIGNLSLIYLALFFVAIGGSMFTPSIYALLGHVYKDRHHLREAGFSIYYASVNIGIFAAMIILGALGNMGYWSIAFTIAGMIQLIGLIPLYKAVQMKSLQEMTNAHRFTLSLKVIKEPLSKKEKNRIAVICILSLVSIVFWLSFNQCGSSMTFLALDYTDRHIGAFEIPPSWLLAFENLYVVLLALPLASLYLFLAKKKKDPSPPMKTAFSLISVAICFMILMVGTMEIPESHLISPWYLITSYFFIALGEMLLAPIGLSLVTHLSPPRFTAFLVGFWYLCIGFAFYGGGVLASLMSLFQDLDYFFLIFVILTGAAAIFLILASKKLNKMRHLE